VSPGNVRSRYRVQNRRIYGNREHGCDPRRIGQEWLEDDAEWRRVQGRTQVRWCFEAVCVRGQRLDRRRVFHHGERTETKVH